MFLQTGSKNCFIFRIILLKSPVTQTKCLLDDLSVVMAIFLKRPVLWGLQGFPERPKFLGNESIENFVYMYNKAASLRAATLSPTNQPRTETPFYRFITNPLSDWYVWY